MATTSLIPMLAALLLSPPSNLESGLEIRSSRKFSPTEVRLNKPIRITGDNVEIDFGGSVLLGPKSDAPANEYLSVAIEVFGRRNVTLRNLSAHGFKVAIHAKNCERLAIVGCDVSRNFRQRLGSTPERENSSDWLWPHHNDKNEWMTRYGGGIVLDRCRFATIRNCRGRQSQNGILLQNTSDSFVYDNDFSYLSGWGIALWRSSNNEISHNRFDYCVRGYSHGVYSRGQDSAGILVFEQCNSNRFIRNRATHGGDGFFLYAGHETTKETGKGGCNDNLVLGNDFSYAVANGIEATFSQGNRFIGNRLDHCDYGIWAGYSSNTTFVRNEIHGSLTAGIAIEHGHDNWIEGNRLENNPRGIWLWWDNDHEFLTGAFGKNQITDSRDNTIIRNRFLDNPIGIELRKTSATKILANQIVASDPAFLFFERCPNLEVRGNNLHQCKNIANNKGETPIALGNNFITDEAPTVDPNRSSFLPAKPNAIDSSKLAKDVETPAVRGTVDPFTPSLETMGRHTIIVDHWGPRSE